MDQKRLVSEILNGSKSAQWELYEHFAPSMLGVCFRYTKSIADAEDVLQDGFVKVFNNLESYRAVGDLGAWIRKIMVNTALTFLKTNKKYRYDLAFEDVVLHPVSSDNPEITLDTKELSQLIRQLPPGYQAIFNLHAIEGYTHVEIAEMMGISDSTSRSQYARARALLIEWITAFSSTVQQENYGRK